MGTVIGSFVGGLLAIFVAVVIYKQIKRKNDTDHPAEPAQTTGPSPEMPDPEHEHLILVRRLVQLNILVRTSYGLSADIIELVENVIDLLKNTAPQMMDRHPSETLTYELKRIAGEHLPQIVGEFIDLSVESRTRHHDTFTGSLSDIRDQVRRAKEIVEHNEVAEFKVMASFLKTKYSSGEF
jgi:hypothetical protein